ncbi:hypothetical protein KUL17_12750 [Alteromonas sp. KUL17]|nr:hypothetical protein KUL17_12750 [Alteromonas sp. KUL17]
MLRLSISIFCAPDDSGVAIQFMPSYRVLFLPSKYQCLVTVWKDSVKFPALPELDGDEFGLSDDEISEFTDLLSHNNLID